MYRAASTLLLVSGFLASGCAAQAPLKVYGFALMEMPAAQSLPDMQIAPDVNEDDYAAEKPGDAPIIALQARILRGSPGRFMELGLDPAKGAAVIPAAKTAALLAGLQSDPGIETISTPRLACASGVPAFMKIAGQSSFVGDYALPGETANLAEFDPVMLACESGLFLSVLARKVEEGVLIDRADARTSEILGVRYCSASVASFPSRVQRLSWHEPVLLNGKVKPGAAGRWRLIKGEALALPLYYEIVSKGAQVRAMALCGEIEECYSNRFDAEGLGPLNRQVVVLLSAE